MMEQEREALEKEERATNIIIFGAEESKEKLVKKRIQDDKSFLEAAWDNLVKKKPGL
jgi:hypothetical protein